MNKGQTEGVTPESPRSVEFGRAAEKVAAAFLVQHDYVIIDTNYRTRHGEIDIVCIRKGCLVLAEVKAARRHSEWYLGDRVNLSKQRKIALAAQDLIGKLKVEFNQVRFDVLLLIELPGKRWKIDHITDAFRLENTQEIL